MRAYGVQGGDWGARIATAIGALDPEHCVAIHLNMALAEPPDEAVELSDSDKADLAALAHFRREESGYALEQSTKPQTVGAGLNDSPAALLAWMMEKFRTWSDCDGHPENAFTRDQLLTIVTTYWVTQTSASAARLYWENKNSRRRGAVRRGSHRRRALPERAAPLAPPLDRAELQRHPLGRHAPRRALRRDGAARALRRRCSELLHVVALRIGR